MGGACLYETIISDLKERISSGEIHGGDKVPSLNQLRDHFDVSHVTALHALRNLVEEGVLEARKGKGYFVRKNVAVRNERVLHGAIACVTRPFREATLYDNYYNDIMQAAQRECMSRKFSVLYPPFNLDLGFHSLKTDSAALIKEKVVEMASGVDGFVLDERIPDDLVNDLREKVGVPMVVVGRGGGADVDYACPDNRGGARQLAEMCLKMNYELFLVGDARGVASCENFDDRINGFIDTLERNGVSDENVIRFDFNVTPYEDTLSLLEPRLREDKKAMIFSPIDIFARWLVDAFVEKGMELGERIGVTGFGGMGYCDYKEPHVSTIDVQPSLIGKTAVSLLAERIEGVSSAAPSVHVIPSVFQIGETL